MCDVLWGGVPSCVCQSVTGGDPVQILSKIA